MGLDQYLYACDKEVAEKRIVWKNLCGEYQKRLDELYAKKYRDRMDSIITTDPDDYTTEQKEFLNSISKEWTSDYTKIANDLGLDVSCGFEPRLPQEIDNLSEIGYWRKNHKLHDFIVKNFGNPEFDNCVDILLNAEQIKLILNFVFDEYSKEVFTEAFNLASNGSVIYYHPWY